MEAMTDVRDDLSTGAPTSLEDPVSQTGVTMVSRDPDQLPELVERVLPAVVQVDVVADGREGNGSGFFFRSDATRGFVITNAHVVEDAAQHTLELNDGRDLPAIVRGKHPVLDIAVLEVREGNMPTLSLRPAGKIRLGESVLALGSPLGLRSSVTSGIVSGLDRLRFGPGQIPTTMIQTDASIIWGNSGGPLIGLDASVVGVNSQIEISHNTLSPGIHYAIPAASAALAAEAILAADNGKVERPTLGAPVQEVPFKLGAEERKQWGQRAGVLVKADPAPKTPAAKAGLKGGDVLIKLDGTAIDDPGDIFTWLLDPKSAERKSSLLVIRDGKAKEIRVQPDL